VNELLIFLFLFSFSFMKITLVNGHGSCGLTILDGSRWSLGHNFNNLMPVIAFFDFLILYFSTIYTIIAFTQFAVYFSL